MLQLTHNRKIEIKNDFIMSDKRQIKHTKTHVHFQFGSISI